MYVLMFCYSKQMNGINSSIENIIWSILPLNWSTNIFWFSHWFLLLDFLILAQNANSQLKYIFTALHMQKL